MLQPLLVQLSLTDSAFPYFRTGSTPLTGRVLFTLLMPQELWFRAAFADALNMFALDEYWQQVGSVTVQEATSAASVVFESWQLMIGYIFPYAGYTAPTGTVLCDGASYLRDDYPNLFSIIGTAYGSVDSTHFNVPDLRGRTPIGQGHGTGLTDRTIGQLIGEETHQLSVGELASHSHEDTGHLHSESIAVPNLTTIGVGAPEPTAIPGVGSTGLGYASISNNGGDEAHNNMQPSSVINFVIVVG